MDEAPRTRLDVDESSGDWSVRAPDGRELMSSAAPPSPEVLRLLDAALALQVAEQAEARPHPANQPEEDSSEADSAANASAASESAAQPSGPSPADLAGSKPLEAPRNWVRAIPAAREWMHRNGVTFGRVREILDDPDDVEALDDGISRLVGRGYEVIIGDDDQTVLSVRPLVPIGQQKRNKPRARGGKADHRRALPDSIAGMVRLLREDGFNAELGRGGHWKITHPDTPGKIMALPATPSDHRWAENTRRDLRAIFGYDPRNPSS